MQVKRMPTIMRPPVRKDAGYSQWRGGVSKLVLSVVA
jgi:hypothetical protein